MIACQELSREVGTAAACKALGIPRPTYYRRRGGRYKQDSPRPAPLRSLSVIERQQILDVLHTDRFVDKAPLEVYATLLDEGVYHCSVRTMYRILGAAGEVRERRNQVRHPHYKAPELLATGPNQVWSWDITKLLGPAKWMYFYLYVILDIFSRYVVGWMIAHQESSALAKRLIAETCEKQNIQRGQLGIHADRGSSMKSKPVALLLSDLGVTKTHSRPHVSNDNPYSESQFKTLKYRPGFPERFGSIQDSRSFCQGFFHWYNIEHRHSGISLLTPEMLHYGKSDAVIAQRRIVLASAFGTHPERFVRGLPLPASKPEAAWINKPKIQSDTALIAKTERLPEVTTIDPETDHQSRGMWNIGSINQVGNTDGNDTKFKLEVSHYR